MSFAAFNNHDGNIYVSEPVVSNDQPLRKFAVSFEHLARGDAANAFTFAGEFFVTINPKLENMQGATFTPWGDLYLVNGMYDPPSRDNGGIHLFNSLGQLISESTNGEGDAFNFEYDPSPNLFEGEEPEGATWWNRDVGPSSPGIGGQLHVILLLNEDITEDNIFFKHYFVDYSCIADGDADNDGLSNGGEIYTTGTDPKNADTDRDRLSDGVEVNVLGTNPLDSDSDNDSIPDGDEDADEDGLSNADEINTYGTNPIVADTDEDGLSDGEEVLTYGSNPLHRDTDEDGLLDGEEVLVYGSDPLDPDTDSDLLDDGLEVTYGTDVLDADTDNDGLLDGKDIEFIKNAIQALQETSFRPSKSTKSTKTGRDELLYKLDSVEKYLLDGYVTKGVKRLDYVRARLDGCGVTHDDYDWILECTDQEEIRELVDVLIANLA